MKCHVLSFYLTLISFMANVSSLHIYVSRKTKFQVVYIRLPALVCSILNVVDTVRTVKVLYSTSASALWDVYIRILTDFSLFILYRGFCNNNNGDFS